MVEITNTLVWISSLSLYWFPIIKLWVAVELAHMIKRVSLNSSVTDKC